MELFKLPFSLGEHEGSEMSVNAGPYGPYIKWNEQFISIPKGEDPLTIDIERALLLIAQKQEAEAPIATYDNLPVTKGKGRFGPFIKWNSMFINVPKRYNFDALTKADINELIETKVAKEANRFIQQWPAEKIAVENGRWGPFIRFNKKMLKVGFKADNTKYTAEELANVSLEEVKKMIETQVPNAFAKKGKAPAKKAAAKKTAPKKAAKKK
jgi:DNA topoisomerase-1